MKPAHAIAQRAAKPRPRIRHTRRSTVRGRMAASSLELVHEIEDRQFVRVDVFDVPLDVLLVERMLDVFHQAGVVVEEDYEADLVVLLDKIRGVLFGGPADAQLSD